jgi:hypothetical protein
MPLTVAPGVTLWSRAEIGLRPFDGARVGTGGKTDSRIHYTTGEELGQPDFRAWWRAIDRFHREEKHWEHGVGYNFGVAIDLHDPQACHILEGRGWYGVGAHTEGHNTAGLGVVFLGDDDPGRADVTPGARRGILWVVNEGSRRHGNRLEPFPHSATGQTACPGDELRAFVHSGLIVPPHPSAVKPATPPKPPAHPVYPGHPLTVLTSGHPQRVWQDQMHKRGWKIGVDGAYGPDSAAVAEAFAKEKRIAVTRTSYRGHSYVAVNRALWDAAWTASVTR